MLDDEIRQLLRDLVNETGARQAAVVHGPVESPSGGADGSLIEPLGNQAFLVLQLSAGRDERPRDVTLAAIARGVRAVRSCARRWECGRVPECKVARQYSEPPDERVRARIREYLRALANAHGADQVAVIVGLELVATSHPADELQRERIPFIVRRVVVEAERRKTSHAELASDDFYAVSFWFDACLLVLFSAPFALDFVRHRARIVTRELVPLLSMLDDDPPPAAAELAPIPD